GTAGQAGLADMPEVLIIGGIDNPHREGLVSMVVKNTPSADIVAKLSDHNIRVHIRRADHYSGNILNPLGLDSCIRVSMCHYNTKQEVQSFLKAMNTILS
ncbi:MAG: aminotransferase class V-fold PLP-dependent enzyme, partial [Proteobacteria bacterium]|nr:aminotransferase class V-fold PLP-dependent enzyme [Pseudomonadota bacterium]